ncbi:MAG TPA: hypothetical protein VMU04_14430 [Candidatus Acidoferrum sp.]|nr:hypothetical protein [Candidatus Acidoferrum sp.]
MTFATWGAVARAASSPRLFYRVAEARRMRVPAAPARLDVA